MGDEAIADSIRLAQRGDPAAYERLVDRFGGRVYGFLYRMTGSRQDAEDLLQEVFVRVVRTIADYQHDGRFEAWLFRIAANLVRDRIRRIKRAPKIISDAAVSSGSEEETGGSSPGGMGASTGPASAALESREDLEALNAALATLPEPEREVIMLRHFSELSFKDIAIALNCPLGTALARAHRGLGHLRNLMQSADHSAADGAAERISNKTRGQTT